MAVITAERQAAIASDLERIVNQIDFTSYDFFSIKQALIQYIKINYPDEFDDFIESSPLIAIVDTVAYVGELLAQRTDMVLREGTITYATNRQHLIDQLKLINYHPQRSSSASGEVILVSAKDSSGNPLTDSTYIVGLPRWIFNPVITTSTAATAADLVTNGTYQTILGNHIPFEVNVGTETLVYELTSTSYQNGLKEDKLSSPSLSLVFDGTHWRCLARQGKTIVEQFTQNIAQANLEYVTTHANADSTVPIVSVAGTEWTYTTSLYLPDPSTTQRYSTKHDQNDRLSILFGDGFASSIPLGDIIVTYRIGDGIKGNIQTTAIQDIQVIKVLPNSLAGGVLESVPINITAVKAFTGGKNRESLEEIRRHAPSFNASQNRQVTGTDYQSAVLEHPAVSIAKAILRTYIGHDATGTYSSAESFVDVSSGTNGSFDTTVNFDGAIPGIDRVYRFTANDEVNRHVITSVTSNNGVFTVGTTADDVIHQGSAATGSTNTVLIDTAATFITSGVKPGYGVKNTTDGSWGIVQSVDSQTQITLTAPLQGGTANTFNVGNSYQIVYWPDSWSTDRIVWEHWAGALDGSTFYIATPSGSGQVVVSGLTPTHVNDSAFIYFIDHYTGAILKTTTADIVFSSSPLQATITLRYLDDTLATGFTPKGNMTMVVDFSYQQSTTPVTLIDGATIGQPAGTLWATSSSTTRAGDILQNGTSGYLVLDVVQNAATVGGTSYDKVFVSINHQNPIAAGVPLTKHNMKKNVTTLENPSRTNVIDIVIISEDASGFPVTYPSDMTTINEVNALLSGTAMMNDIVFVQWGVLKSIPVDLTVHLKPNVLNTTDLQSRIQQATFDYFKIGRFNFGDPFKISPLISYLHSQFSEIDYIDHSVLSTVDGSVKSNEMITVDRNHRGVIVV